VIIGFVLFRPRKPTIPHNAELDIVVFVEISSRCGIMLSPMTSDYVPLILIARK
jgi:hypothetical protein